MPLSLKPFFKKELDSAAIQLAHGNLHQSWRHLERAHIIGQSYPYQHSLVHYKMLLFGVHTKNAREIIGQIPRLLVGGIKSFVGEIPVGNTGGANVPPLQPMPIPDDLLHVIRGNTK